MSVDNGMAWKPEAEEIIESAIKNSLDQGETFHILRWLTVIEVLDSSSEKYYLLSTTDSVQRATDTIGMLQSLLMVKGNEFLNG